MITHPRHQPRSTVKLLWAKLPDRTSIYFALPRGTALWPLHTLMGRPVCHSGVSRSGQWLLRSRAKLTGDPAGIKERGWQGSRRRWGFYTESPCVEQDWGTGSVGPQSPPTQPEARQGSGHSALTRCVPSSARGRTCLMLRAQ